MAVERIDTEKVDAADLGWETRTLTYTIVELRLAGMAGVISQNQVVLHFRNENPELIVKKVQSFKMNQADQTVILRVKVAKRRPIGSELATKSAEELIAEREPITQGHGVECVCGECELNRDLRKITTDALDKIVDENPLPITDPARLLPEGEGAVKNYTAGPIIEAADHDIIDGKHARIEVLEQQLEAGRETVAKKDARIAELETQLDGFIREGVSAELGGALRITELEKENAALKSVIEKFGSGQDFDWDVLGRIERLEVALEYIKDPGKEISIEDIFKVCVEALGVGTGRPIAPRHRAECQCKECKEHRRYTEQAGEQKDTSFHTVECQCRLCIEKDKVN